MEAVAANKFTRFYNFLANMGLVIRDDPPKVIDMTGREWGETVDGLALSIRELKREDPRQVAGISVVMKNVGPAPKPLTIPSWIRFYQVEGLERSPYERQVMGSNRDLKNIEVALGPGDAIETDLPVGTLYNTRAPGTYTVRISCGLPDGAILRSNEIKIRV
jgi:hypothetical protein